MNKNKLSYIGLLLMILFSITNIFIYINVIPFVFWRIQNIIFFVIAIFMLSQKIKVIKNINKPLTILGFIIAIIFIFTEFSVLLKFI